MLKQLQIAELFASEAILLTNAREKAKIIHKSSDIKAAGNEVEIAVREYLARMLPPRYYVTHGHLIDVFGSVSPQLDVIVADNFGLPSLLTTEDGTEYVPVTSVLAIGEVKSTYYSSQKPYKSFHEKLVKISQLHRPLVENTAFGGIQRSTTVRDIFLGLSNKYLNNLYSFFISVDSGDFGFDNVRHILRSADVDRLPSVAIFLNKGVIAYGNRQQLGSFHKYPNERDTSEYGWCYVETKAPEKGSIEGVNLSFLYGQLISHLSASYLERPNVYDYIGKQLVFSKSSMRWAEK